jgi:TolB-like protein
MKRILLLFLMTHFVVSVFSQNAVSLDTGFTNSIRYFEERITRGSKLVVFNFRSASEQLSGYIMEELTVYFVNSGHFTVVDRSNLELLQQEMAFQLSGEVSDDTALSIGRMLGAHIIISGSIEPLGDVLRLRIRGIAVESAAILGIFTANIQRDRFLNSFLVNTPPTSGNTQQSTNPQPPQSLPQGGGAGRGNVMLPDFLLN